jgi:hypothetical protein
MELAAQQVRVRFPRRTSLLAQLYCNNSALPVKSHTTKKNDKKCFSEIQK